MIVVILLCVMELVSFCEFVVGVSELGIVVVWFILVLELYWYVVLFFE